MIAVHKIDSASQLADLFTKALKPADHARLASLVLGAADVHAGDAARRNIFTQPALSACKAQLNCSRLKHSQHALYHARHVNPAA